ncbi:MULTISPECIES: type II toxin-antitoxin system RelE/ParE family toxin [unclassified Chryseobacterium]|uniref:type II toxin-antitoxin system RelE/ParE family toxin n=1 Tax=unclassified Chryseobacterium TaxID=2593645 RepID=UPI002269B7EC|nr:MULTISPECIES: type II toxin-antitoxin system RelE/ParE family toxin [unclassified Chryseobacterium]
MAKYFLTNKAVQDLSEIYEYTYTCWSETQAEKYYLELIDFCQMLSENPNIGKSYPVIDQDLLGFPAQKHIIFYKSISKDEIEIIRILGGNMDLKNRLHE